MKTLRQSVLNPSWNVDWCVSQETDMCSLTNTAILSNGHVAITTNNLEDKKKNSRANMKASLTKVTSLSRSGSVKNLIHKFSVSESSDQITPNVSPSQQQKDGTGNAKESEIPAVTVTPPSGKSKNVSNGPNVHSDSGQVSVCAVCSTRPDNLCSRRMQDLHYFTLWVTCLTYTLVVNVTCVWMHLHRLSPHH